MSWKSLKGLYESHPVKTYEYSILQGIDHEPGFNWWVDDVMTKGIE